MNCGQGDSLPEITAAFDPEEGFQDIILRILEISFDVEGGCTMRAMGTFEGKLVGTGIAMQGGMRPFFVGGDIDKQDSNAFFPRGIVFNSLGEPSDNLVAALSKLYGITGPLARMRAEVAFGCAAIDGDPRQVRNQPVYFKLFFGEPSDDEGPDDQYCELYCNLHLKDRLVEIKEKDGEYRPGVIRALTTDPGTSKQASHAAAVDRDRRPGNKARPL